MSLDKKANNVPMMSPFMGPEEHFSMRAIEKRESPNLHGPAPSFTYLTGGSVAQSERDKTQGNEISRYLIGLYTYVDIFF